MLLMKSKLKKVAVLTIKGDVLDASNSKEFKQQIPPLLEGETQILLNMENLEFMDSSGCGALLSALRQVAAKGGDFKVCGMQRPVQTLFELVRMHRIVQIYATQEEAVASFD